MHLVAALREGLSSEPVENRPAGIEIRQELKPAGGLTAAPPSYDPPLEIHDRLIDGEKRSAIELDSVGSAANRIEEALNELYEAGDYPLPVASTTIDPGNGLPEITISTLSMPHRSFDAWLRLSEDDEGVKFEATDLGLDLTLAHPKKLDALLETSAHDLLFGVWDSHRKGPHGQLRIGRSLTTSMIGLDPIEQRPIAARRDPLNLGESSDLPKGTKKLSEQGLSSIPPVRTKSTVSISEALFLGYLSFPALRRLGFENYDATEVRVMLALLGIYGLLLRNDQGWELRSGASFVPTGPMKLELVRPATVAESIDIDVAEARRLFEEAVARVGIQDRKVHLKAGKTLNDIVAKSISETKKQD